MPDKTKKTFVKVAKTAPIAEAYVPAGLTKDVIKKINETTELNKKRVSVEGIAKNDSIASATKAKFAGKDIVDQARAGNKAANETRVKDAVPQVIRGREHVNNAELKDKYSTGVYTSTRDSYSRTNPLEKDMPVVKKTFVKVKKA